MRRRLVLILLLLAGGAIVNVAVAWGFACHPSASQFGVPDDYVRYQYKDQSLLDGMVHQKVGTRYVAIAYMKGRYTPREDSDDVRAFVDRQPPFARRNILEWFGRIDAPSPPSDYIAVIARGWPMHSLYSIEEVHARRRQAGTRAEFSDRGAIVIPAMTRRNTGSAPFYACALPLVPVWPAFAINTLMYAAILCGCWVLFAAPFTLRRRRRIKRGLCVKCGYDLRNRPGDSTACPECGASR